MRCYGLLLAILLLVLAAAGQVFSAKRDVASPSAASAASRPAKQPAKRRLSPAQQQRLLHDLESRLGQINTLWVEFHQRKHLSLFTDVVEADGRILYRRPGFVRLGFTKPFRSVLVAQPNRIAKFEKADGRWRRIEQADEQIVLIVTRQIGRWLSGQFRGEDDVYRMEAYRRANGAPELVLVPRDDELLRHVRAIEIRLDEKGSRIAKVIIREPGGDYTEMRFHSEIRNFSLPRRVFDTTGSSPAALPPGPRSQPATAPAEGGA